MKAVVLAAGEGRRLEPLTNRRPKPMLPIAGKPLIEYVLDAIVEAGIDEVVFVVGYARDRIQTYFGDGDDWAVEIEYVVQEKQLGTAHAIAQAETVVDERFVVLNGDRIIESACITNVCDQLRTDGGPVMAVTRSTDPGSYGVVELDDRRVVDIAEKPRDATSDVINAGVYGFDERIFDAIRGTEPDESGERQITATLRAFLQDGGVHAARYDGLCGRLPSLGRHARDAARSRHQRRPLRGRTRDRCGGRGGRVRQRGHAHRIERDGSSGLFAR